jgi:pimeloyl-ACP methyl ester carboxylesterase
MRSATRAARPICSRHPHEEEGPIDADLLRIPVGPGSMHVERYGHGGAPIVLIHGFGTSCFLWRNVGPRDRARQPHGVRHRPVRLR